MTQQQQQQQHRRPLSPPSQLPRRMMLQRSYTSSNSNSRRRQSHCGLASSSSSLLQCCCFLWVVILLFQNVISIDAFGITHAAHHNRCGGIRSVLQPQQQQQRRSSSLHLAYYDDPSQPSDYDTKDIVPTERTLEVDSNEEDTMIRDALKRELLLLSSVTNRGEYATIDEQNMLIDLVAQLEALNPTMDPTSNCMGEWDLCLSSTQFFRSSPFFQSIRSSITDSTQKSMIETAFDIHDRATTSGRIGRVRQTITNSQQLISSIDLEVGILPGLPFRMKGTVVTTASFKVTSRDTYELQIQGTRIHSSNVPILNQFIEENQLEVPMSTIYETISGTVPICINKIFYLDEGMSITRDQDDNFFVYTRS